MACLLHEEEVVRRPALYLTGLALLAGISFSSPVAWSHADRRCPHYTGTWQQLDCCGVTLNITTPMTMHVVKMCGPGDVVIEQAPNSWYYEPEFRTLGAVQLQGWPNGWGGYETAVYKVHTSESGTTAEVVFDRNPWSITAHP
jgi:hypothetical protein